MSRHLMARFRHLADAHENPGWADWKVTAEFPYLGGGARAEEARLENGHWLHISSGTWGSNRPPWRWHWGIYDADDNEITGSGEHDPPAHTPEEARRSAEAKYEELFPAGKADTGPRDSQIDYDSIINPKDSVSDDYGDIFREGR